MVQPPRPRKALTVSDPEFVPEILCDGRFNITPKGSFATLTFTHERPKPGPLLEDGRLEYESVVRARIVISLNSLVAFRDLLNRSIQELPPGGGKAH
jgi:hypothetical protein